MGKKKNRISEYNPGIVAVDIIMLLLGLTFIIGFATGKASDIRDAFIRVVGGILIAVAIFELINFLRIKEKAMFDWVVMVIGSAIGILGIVLVAVPGLFHLALGYAMAIVIWVYAVSIIFTAVFVLRPANAKYWWFPLIFGFLAFILGVIVIIIIEKDWLILFIGITLVVGAVGGLSNVISGTQAKKEFKKSSKLLADADYTVESTTVEGETEDGKKGSKK